MKTLEDTKEFLEDISLELQDFESSTQMLQTLLEFSKENSKYPKEKMTSEFKIKGCSSNAYISITKNQDNSIIFEGFAEAIVARGYVGLLIDALENLNIKDINNPELDNIIENFTKTTNIKASLTPSRANAFGSIYTHIKELAKKLE